MARKIQEIKTLSLGSMSSGTMRPEDLIPVFLGELAQVDRKHAVQVCKGYRKVLNYVYETRETPYTQEEEDTLQEDIGYLLESLEIALSEHVPSYCYFGSHPGDGADYGVWVDEDAILDAIHNDEILAVDGLDEVTAKLVEDGEVPGLVLETNDHGNQTLWSILPYIDCAAFGVYKLKVQYTEVWGIV